MSTADGLAIVCAGQHALGDDVVLRCCGQCRETVARRQRKDFVKGVNPELIGVRVMGRRRTRAEIVVLAEAIAPEYHTGAR